MSKTKRLLSVTLAIAMIILSAFSAFAEDTETVVETVGAMSVAAVSIENDDTRFDVNVKISFNEDVTGPHNIITLTCEKFDLTDVELGYVVYNYTSSEKVNGETVQLPQGKVTIAEDGVKNANWATGKVLIEAPVDVNAPLVSEINLTATFTRKADVALEAGETLNIAVANDDMVDASETKLSISAGANVATVHGVGNAYGYDETNHWLACVVEGCTEHIGENAYDYAEHSYDAGVVTDPTTTSKGYTTYTCECGYSYTDNEVDELAVAFVPYYDPTASTLRVHYEYPADSSALMKTKLAYAKAQGNRKIEYILTIEGKDYSFEMDKISSGWFIQVANFGIHDTYLDAEICIKISWGGEDPGSWTTNSLDFNISKLVAAGKIEDTSNSATDTIVALSDDIINAYNAMITEYEKLSETDYIVMSSGVSTEEGYISYAVNYYPKSTDIQITYTYGDDFKNDVLTPAKGQGTDKRAISYKMSVCDSDPYVFEMTKISSGLYVQPAGFTIHDLDNIKVWLHVEGYDTDNTEVVHDTNAVTLNINEGIATDSSAFAVAYTAFMKLI